MTHIAVRPADLEADRDLVISTLLRYLTRLSDGCRFDWLYKNNPHGQARAWVVYNADNGAPIGVASAFPRRVYLGGSDELAWVLGDFCIDNQYRSLGPALKLQRACLEVIESNGGMFCYDFPSASMVAIYKRLGISLIGKMLRLAKPLRVDRKVKEKVTNPLAQHMAVLVGNTLLKMGLPKGKADESLEISVHKLACGEEFTDLAREERGGFGIGLQRSAGYLNWRYVDNPLAHHEIVTARRNGRLVGYAVWTQTGEDAAIVDLFGEDDPGMVRRLVAEVVNSARSCELVTLSVSLNESHQWRSLFSEMGFRVRDSIPVVISPSKTLSHRIDPQLTGWYLMQGDRDC